MLNSPVWNAHRHAVVVHSSEPKPLDVANLGEIDHSSLHHHLDHLLDRVQLLRMRWGETLLHSMGMTPISQVLAHVLARPIRRKNYKRLPCSLARTSLLPAYAPGLKGSHSDQARILSLEHKFQPLGQQLGRHPFASVVEHLDDALSAHHGDVAQATLVGKRPGEKVKGHHPQPAEALPRLLDVRRTPR